jgi:hypothetical protein
MKKAWLGVFAALTMVGSAACSSSGDSGTAGKDAAGTDTLVIGGDTKPVEGGGTDTKTGTDVKPVDGSKTDADTPTDMTTGKPCTDDATCDVTGAGINSCGNAFAIGTIYPDPVCLGRGCDIGDGTSIMGCDHDLGVCLDDGASGICLGACAFGADGGALTTPCVGKDACNVLGWGKDASGKLQGVGYCFGGCTADADCKAGNKCQKESGLCVKTVLTYTKAVGDPCTDADAKSPAKCECLYLTTTKKGYCSSFCKVGDATTSCPTGFTCSPGLPTKDSTDGSALFSKDPTGIGANCLKNCTTDADCTTINSTCRDTASGKVCYPAG